VTLPDAVVFDCDGTLVDTEPISDASWHEVLGAMGHEVTGDDLAAVLGRPWPHVYDYWAGRLDVPPSHELRLLVRDSFVRIFDEQVRLFDDAVTVARELKSAGVPLAVCTSSSRQHLDRVFALGITDLFDASVSAEDTDRHKPDPAPYLEAARRLDIDPRACTAIEDSPVGVAAAVAAGMRTIAVVRNGIDPAMLDDAAAVVDRVTIEAILDRDPRT
jgi:HAD superfamily hydrolase (TIGR01509 family)